MPGDGQKWCAAVEPNYFLRGDRFTRRIVMCHTTQMRPGEKDNACLLHGGRASWERCSSCDDNHGFSHMSSPEYPRATMVMCKTRDLDYRVERVECRECYQRMQCMNMKLFTKGKRVHLTLIA